MILIHSDLVMLFELMPPIKTPHVQAWKLKACANLSICSSVNHGNGVTIFPRCKNQPGRTWPENSSPPTRVQGRFKGCKCSDTKRRSGSWEQLGVSKNRGTPKWMIYNGKPYQIDDLGIPLFSETPN